MCSSSPLASVVHIGGQEEGLRYLHCSICETEWHMVCVKCSNCASTEGISYRRLESVDTPLMSREDLGFCQDSRVFTRNERVTK